MTKAQRIRQRKSVDSYKPELLQALIKAGTEGIQLPCPDRATAITLRHRLYSLRMAMKREEHPQYPLIAQVVLSVFHHTEKGWLIEASVGDEKLLKVLEDAGITAPDIPDLEL